MEDTELNFEKSQINWKTFASSDSKWMINDNAEQNFCIGQSIHFDVTIPLSKNGIEQLKIPHPSRSPATANLLKCLMRQISSTLDVKTSISPVDKQARRNESHLKSESPVWISCPLQTSHPPDGNPGLSKSEPYLKDNKTYNVPVQMKLLNVPTYCDDVDLTVDIKQGQRLGPEWLSSPTRPDPLVFHKNEGGNTKRLRQRLKVIHPPELNFQHKTVSGKQLLLLQVYNGASHGVSIEDCYIMPESCPVKVCKHSSDLQSDIVRKPCPIHGNMVKLLNTEFSVFPVQLLPDETVSLMFSLHLTSGTDYLAKEDITLLGQLKWHVSDKNCDSDIISAYSLPTIKIKQAHFVMSAICKEDKVQAGDCFTITYHVSNRLQDFLSVKLYWSPAVLDDSPEEEQRLQQLAQGLLCCDPQVQLGACPFGSVMEAQVRFQALRPGLYEVCKHMKINLRYLLPSESESIQSPSSQISSQSGDDRLTSTSEEIWRERSGSGSSYKEQEGPQGAERRLSLANKSYSVGDLVDNISPKSKTSEGRKLLLSSEKQSCKYEQMSLNPANFLKNSCEVYVTASTTPRQFTEENLNCNLSLQTET